MARQFSVTCNHGDARRSEAILRVCRRATEIDPNYARAWALIADAEGSLRLYHGRENDGGMAAAERAVALDPNLAEGHAARAQILTREARHDEALSEIAIALRLAGTRRRDIRSVITRGQRCLRYFSTTSLVDMPDL
jgi:adenylate cyclase